jgi:hypothetical protein
MPSFYHGSYRRFMADVSLRLAKDVQNGWRKLTRSGGKNDNSKKSIEVEIGRAISSGGRAAGLARLDVLIEEALRVPEPRNLHYLASALERFGEYGRAYPLRARGHALIGPELGQAWDGKPSPENRLVITPMRYDQQSLSYSIQYASLIGLASELVEGCTVYLNPRLIPLFQRSFPKARFASEEEIPDRPCADGQLHAGLESLPALFASSADAIAAAHRPLRADPDLTARLRARYRQGARPVIGIAWGSSNARKDVPGLKLWADLLADLPARLVSLQYGEVGAAVARLSAAGKADIIVDPEIDQFMDMDGFAAQLAAVDAVLSVSNTGAHLAGAMGRPSVVLLDDRFHLTWPYFATATPWYPNTILLRRNGYDWARVMAAARGRLLEILPPNP